MRSVHSVHSLLVRARHRYKRSHEECVSWSACKQINRSFTVYVSGSAWTGALGLGRGAMTHPDTSEVSDEDRENKFTELYLNPLQTVDTSHSTQCNSHVFSVAAGWGHSAFIVIQKETDAMPTTKLLVCGRPFDFQSLLRLKRLPSILRRPLLQFSLLFEESASLDKAYTSQPYAGIKPTLTEVSLPSGDVPINNSEKRYRGNVLAASAGTTAVIGESGKLYMFGANQRGQCGVNEVYKNHIWDPTPIVFAPSETLLYEPTFSSVALGLQHGLAVDTSGSLFSWGKSHRGQLGVRKGLNGMIGQKDTSKTADNWFDPADLGSCEYAALRITEFHRLESAHNKEMIIPASDIRVKGVSAGFNHSAAFTECNQAWVWGKNTKPLSTEAISISKVASDSLVPISIQGLPTNMEIIDISCGSHHTSILLEDGSVYAIGITTDTLNILHDAVQIVPPGLIQQPILQFSSHFDRTTIVHGKGSVIEVHLWEDLRNEGVFEPAFVQTLESRNIKMVHRGWLHNIVVTND